MLPLRQARVSEVGATVTGAVETFCHAILLKRSANGVFTIYAVSLAEFLKASGCVFATLVVAEDPDRLAKAFLIPR